MARQKSSANEPHEILAALALRHAGAEQGIACAGTAIEKRTIRARNKAFLFLGPRDAMLKLRESLGEAQRLTKAEPGRYRAGAGGWVKVNFGPEQPADIARLTRWIAESHRVLAGESSSAKARAPAKRKAPAKARAKPAKKAGPRRR